MRRQVVGWAQHRAKHRARSRTEKTLRSRGRGWGCYGPAPSASSSDLEGWLGLWELLSPSDWTQV